MRLGPVVISQAASSAKHSEPFAPHSAVSRLRSIRPLRSRMLVTLLSAIYVLILLEDALRKTFGAPNGILIVKDILILFLYCIYLRRCVGADKTYWAPVWIVGVCLLAWLTLEATLPRAGIVTFLLALKTYLLYVPLMCIGRVAFANERIRRRILGVLTLAGTAIGAAAIGSALLRDSAPPLLQPIVEEVATHSYTYGELFLAPSIFATGEKAADQLLLAALAATALVLEARNTRRRLLAVGALAVCLVGLFATARRTPLILALIGMLILFIQAKRLGARRGSFPLGRTIYGVIVVAVISVIAIGTLSIQGFVGYITDVRNGANVVRQFVALPPDFLRLEGNGSGTATQGATHLGLQAPTYFGESEGIVAKVWFELGPVGFGLYVLLIGVALRSVFRATRRGGRAEFSVPECAATLFVVAVLIMALKGFQQFDNSQVQITFWLAAGFASRYTIGISGGSSSAYDPKVHPTRPLAHSLCAVDTGPGDALDG